MNKIIDYRIVISEFPQLNEMRAASFIRENIKLVCGKKLEIVKDSEPSLPLEIVVGKTNRELSDGVELLRSESGEWEYKIFKVRERLYLTGLGIAPESEPAYTSAYAKMRDGAIGTVMAAYRFVEDILGYSFVFSSFEEFPEKPMLEMPKEYCYSFTREEFRRQRPKYIEGAALYSLNCSERLDWNTGSFIIKTRTGRLIVIDGGHQEELPRLIECLRSISGEEKPAVTAWLFSHLHGDHYGAYVRLTEEEWRDKLTVKDVYCNLISKEFWLEQPRGKDPELEAAYTAIMESDKTLNASVHVVSTGDLISVDEVEFEVIHIPNPAYSSEMNINDTSVVYKMTYDKGQTVMFLGDAEWVCNEDLVTHCADKLKSDVVQVGHHGCGNVSKRCYELIGAEVYIWQCGERFWYQESGEGLNTHNAGYIRYRSYMMELGAKMENVYITMDNIHSLPLPIPIFR